MGSEAIKPIIPPIMSLRRKSGPDFLNSRTNRNLTHFEVDEEMACILKKEQTNKNLQEYKLKKKLQEEDDKKFRKARATKSMQYLLQKSKIISEFFKEKLQEHTQENEEHRLKTLLSNGMTEVAKEKDFNRDCDVSGEALKFDVMDKLKYFKGVLKPYQVEGVAWMSILFENDVNGILADEMGLGKTIEVIALICHLYERRVEGPYLIIVPLSTIPNWDSEFHRFAPNIPIVVFHGTYAELPAIKQKIDRTYKVDDRRVKPVIITAYHIVLKESSFLQKFKWQYLIVDEGHRLKNVKCELVKELNKLETANKLILTGTPLQNNLTELWALLNFLLPDIFEDVSTFDSLLLIEDLEEHKATPEKTDVISKIHSILAPFMLRRLKSDVLIELVPKKEVLVYCPLTQLQKNLYTYIIQRDLERLTNTVRDSVVETIDVPNRKRACRRSIPYTEDMDIEYIQEKEEKTDYDFMIKYCSRITMQNRMSMYRKVVNHPYLIHMPLDPDSTKKTLLVDENLVNISGKMLVLDAMLAKLFQRGHKVLLFSTLVMMLDLIAEYVEMRGYSYCRLDGRCKLPDRQENIDTFNQDPRTFLFLISTRAGGLGLNLTGADTVILFDRDWNPQIDIQAQDRCHRIGQLKPVMIYSLITKNTIDERVVNVGNKKRKLEKVVIKDGKFKTLGTEFSTEMDLKELKELQELIESDHSAEKIHSNGYVFSKRELDKLLDRRDMYEEMKRIQSKSRKLNRNQKLKMK